VQADASVFHNPFKHKKQPVHVPLTMESDVPIVAGMTQVEKYIHAYQGVRDSLHKFREDEKPAEIEGAEIAAVQADLDLMGAITDPEHDPKLPVLADQLAKDVTAMVDLDNCLMKMGYVSFYKRPKADPQWAIDLDYVNSELLRLRADHSKDPWYAETRAAFYRAADDRENYLADIPGISAERVTNDINEARFDLHCIGSHMCELRKQNEGN